jgi:flavin-binding protein dodecin
VTIEDQRVRGFKESIMATQTEHAQAPSVLKVVEMVGVSPQSWEDAARVLVARASGSIRHITGIDLVRSTAVVQEGKITEYHVTAKVAFIVEPATIEKK